MSMGRQWKRESELLIDGLGKHVSAHAYDSGVNINERDPGRVCPYTSFSFGYCLGAGGRKEMGSRACSMPNKTAHGSCNNPCFVIFNKDLNVVVSPSLFSYVNLWLILSLNM